MYVTLGVSVVLALAGGLLTLVPSTVAEMCPQDVRVTVSEMRLREMATRTFRPVCPASLPATLLPSVATAEIDIAIDGRVMAATAIQAPSAESADAISAALRQWTFVSTEREKVERRVRHGKLTFYLVPDASTCRVLHANEAPAYRDWPGGLVPIARGAGLVQQSRAQRSGTP